VNDLHNDETAAALFGNKEVYENDKNELENVKGIQVNSAPDSVLVEHIMNRTASKKCDLGQGWSFATVMTIS
jgi:hypothetical protein